MIPILATLFGHSYVLQVRFEIIAYGSSTRATLSPTHTLTLFSLQTAAKHTRKIKKCKPRRPLSAYNYFFSEERQTILAAVSNPSDPTLNNPNSEDYLDQESIRKLKKENHQISFEELGKLIGNRWKHISPKRLARYSEMASADLERYNQEKHIYTTHQNPSLVHAPYYPCPNAHNGVVMVPSYLHGMMPASTHSLYDSNAYLQMYAAYRESMYDFCFVYENAAASDATKAFSASGRLGEPPSHDDIVPPNGR